MANERANKKHEIKGTPMFFFGFFALEQMCTRILDITKNGYSQQIQLEEIRRPSDLIQKKQIKTKKS